MLYITMHHALSSVRNRRRALGLSQNELASLLGRICRAHLSKLERGVRNPSLEVAIALEVLYNERIERLFPKLYRDVEKEVVLQLERIRATIKDDATPRRLHTKKLIEETLARITIH